MFLNKIESNFGYFWKFNQQKFDYFPILFISTNFFWLNETPNFFYSISNFVLKKKRVNIQFSSADCSLETICKMELLELFWIVLILLQQKLFFDWLQFYPSNYRNPWFLWLFFWVFKSILSKNSDPKIFLFLV